MNNHSGGELSFRANAGIKDIIGRGLILDDNIAIIELIKNSKDAGSKLVKVHFNRADDLEASSLVIKDFGHGMDLDDIRDKWLNIAYSEKKEKSPKGKKFFAGSKGVGRFSCDRLGEELVLLSKAKNGEYIRLPISWTLFEVNQIDAEISTVKLNYEVISEERFLTEIDETSFNSGTVLIISNLRSHWEERQLVKLRTELEKFISDPDSNFQVKLKIDDGEEQLIQNSVFEELEFKTYNIKSKISADGSTITTALRFQGEIIYEYTVENQYPNLRNVQIDAHYLNFTAKVFFKRRTGYSTNEYGSVFMFLNGFRISPYGNPKNDWLGLDQRKSQGTARYMGTRELLGKVSVIDINDTFAPISSREGLVQNSAYRELTSYDPKQKILLKNGKLDYGYVPHILRQLERFVVQGLRWHSIIDLSNPEKKKVINDRDLKKDPTQYAIRKIDQKAVKDVIEKTLRTSNFNIEEYKINSKLISRLSQEAEDEYNEYILSFVQNTTGKSFSDLDKSDKRALKRIASRNMEAIKNEKVAQKEADEQRLRAKQAEEEAAKERKRREEAEEREKQEKLAREAAEAAAKLEVDRRKTAEKKLKEVSDENIFHKMDANKNLEHIINLHHQIILYSSTAESDIENLKDLLRENDAMSDELVFETVSSIEDQIIKISKFSEFATSQKYKLALNEVTGNLVQFVGNYLNEVKSRETSLKRISLENKLDLDIEYHTDYSPLNIMILVDNLISNSKRALASKILFVPPKGKGGLFSITDNGVGIHSSIDDNKKIFKKGFTTSDEGSGRGLFHVKSTLEEIGLGIRVIDNFKSGFNGLSFEVFKDDN